MNNWAVHDLRDHRSTPAVFIMSRTQVDKKIYRQGRGFDPVMFYLWPIPLESWRLRLSASKAHLIGGHICILTHNKDVFIGIVY